MNVRFGLKTAVLALSSLAMTVSFSACGSSDQSNPPLVAADAAGAVELVDSNLQYDASGTTITGTVTTKYTDALTPPTTATLSGFSSTVTGCSVNSTTVIGDTVTYTDSSDTLFNITISLSAACTTNSVTISATETDETNATVSWARSAAVTDALPGAIASPIATIVPTTETQNIVLTTNNQPVSIALNIFDSNNVPLSEGEIAVRYPDEVINGIDVGSMVPIDKVSVVGGQAVFTYTGPSDLNSSGDGVTFSFFDPINPSNTVDVFITFSPDTSVPLPILTAYSIDFVSSTESVTMNLNTKETFTLSVRDEKGNLVDAADVVSTKITTNQPSIAVLIDDNSLPQSELTFAGENAITMLLETNIVSGLVDFSIELQIRDANGVVGDKNVTTAVTVFSGPATAITIHYAGTSLDEETIIFYDKMIVRLADKWDNPVNTNPRIAVAAIAGYKTSTGSGIGNDYAIDYTRTATVSEDPIGAKLAVTSGLDLTNVDEFNDILMTFGADYKFHASGKWDIDSVVGAEIFLKDGFNDTTAVDEIGFAIGRNYRNDLCTNDKYILNVDSQDGTYAVNSDGIAIVDMSYEPLAVGQNVMMSVNLIGMVNELGKEMRLGEVEEHTLRGHGLEDPGSFSVAKLATGTVTFSIPLTGTAEFLRSARFGYLPETTGSVTATCISSDDNKTVQYSTTSCQSWIQCTYDGGADGGSINIKGASLGSEF